MSRFSLSFIQGFCDGLFYTGMVVYPLAAAVFFWFDQKMLAAVCLSFFIILLLQFGRERLHKHRI